MNQSLQHTPLSKFALTVLRKLDSGQPIHVTKSGDGRLRGRTLPASLMRELLSRDLIDVRGQAAVLSSRGKSLLLRQQSGAKMAGRECPPPNAFQAQHGAYKPVKESIEGRRRTVLRNTAVDAVEWLSRRKGRDGRPLLGPAQKMAAERFQRDFETAHLRQKMTASYDGVPRDKSPARAAQGYMPGEVAGKARQRIDDAMQSVGPGLNEILFRVCGNGEGLEIAETSLGWPRRSGRIVLQIALARLADHYGLDDKI